MFKTTDQLGRQISLDSYPKRIVSLVPSQTEYLLDLGLDKEVVGITRFCIYPENKVQTITKIGGTKQFNIEKIKALQPDLIIGNKEENYLQGIEELQKHFAVWMSDIYTLTDAYTMMHSIAELVGKPSEGELIIEAIKTSFLNLEKTNLPKPSCCYFIWRKPYMVAANNTFINHLLNVIGFSNVFQNINRYPQIDVTELAELKPDYIFLSTEPYSFSAKHLEEFKAFSPSSKVVLVNGEMFSWYGSRLKYAAAYFNSLKAALELN